MSIVITGANGYIGRSLCEFLYNKGIFFKTVTRGSIQHQFHHGRNISCDFSQPFNLESELKDCRYLVHLASCVHNKIDFSEEDYRIVNIEATRMLAKQASIAKMQRFIFFSSAAVFGQESPIKKPYSVDSACLPVTCYGKSKLAAEAEIKNICNESNLSYSIIRPPMVYGKDAPGNWNRILKFLSYGPPMPLGSISNLRSFLFIGNLLSFVETIINSNKAEDKTFLVTDDNDISTTQLVNEIKGHEEYNFLNFRMNHTLLDLIFKLLRLSKVSNQLTKNMQLDISYTKSQLNWKPPFNLKESIRKSI